MTNSNELFRTYIISQLEMVTRGFIQEAQAGTGVLGYYTALNDMHGVDNLTTQYNDLARVALYGTTKQKKNAYAMLKGELVLSTVLDNF